MMMSGAIACAQQPEKASESTATEQTTGQAAPEAKAEEPAKEEGVTEEPAKEESKSEEAAGAQDVADNTSAEAQPAAAE